MTLSDFYSLFSQLLYFISLFLQGVFLYRFLGSFLTARYSVPTCPSFSFSSLCHLSPFLFYLCLRTVGEALLPSDYSSRIFFKLLISLIAILLTLFLFYQDTHGLGLFLVVTFLALCEICHFIAYSILHIGEYLTDFWLYCLDKGCFSPESFLRVTELSLLLLLLLQQLAFLFLLSFFLRKIVFFFREKKYSIHRTEALFLLTPGLVSLLLCIILRILMITMENDLPVLLYQKHPILAVLVPVLLSLCLFSILCSIKLFQDMVALNREENRRLFLERQLMGTQKQLQEVEHLYTSIRGLRHDMKNTLGIIMELTKDGLGGTDAELQAYLSSLKHTMDSLELPYHTGHQVADILLGIKQHELHRTLPLLSIQAEDLLFPPHLEMEYYDLGVILGNALDNAIEACQTSYRLNPQAELFIRVSSFFRENMLFLQIENSFSGKLEIHPSTKLPLTGKSDSLLHGIGLGSIKATAEKYFGTIQWTAQHQIFTLTVMLKVLNGN